MTIESIDCTPVHSASLSDEMARHYTPRIRRHAARYARRLPGNIGVSDLVSAGFEGLADAYVRFDRSRPETFEAYIDHRIRGAILDELRDHDPLTRDQRTFARRCATVTRRLATTLGRTPLPVEVAEALEITVDALHSQLARANDSAARNSASELDDDVADPYETAWARPDEMAQRSERREMLQGAVAQLTERQQLVLRMHYEQDHTLREIAETLGVTESRVSQIHSEAVTRLRKLASDA